MDDAKEIWEAIRTRAGKKEQNQNCLLTMDDGVVNWGEHIVEVETNHALMTISSNNEANKLYENDEKLKKYRRIGMKALKEKEQLQKTVDSWKDSSKNLWRLVNSGMSSSCKIGLRYEITSNNEVLSYEEEMNRTVFNSTEEDFIEKPVYNRFSKTDNLKGSFGNPSKHSVEFESEIISVPKEMSESKSVTTNETDHPLKNMKDRGIFDSGCSGHMTSNKDHLDDFEEFKGGSVTFGGSKGYITGKDRIKHKVLFTKTECLVVTSDFKMLDENQILLKVPRQHNMYSFDMKTPGLAKSFACLIAKATSDESKLWHRRLDTLSVLGKFDGKSYEGFLVGYSLNNKAYRVYNLVTKRVKVNLHVKFLKEKPNVKGVGYKWMFDIDYLTDSMNYIPVSLENQAKPHAGTSKVTNSAGTSNTNASEEEDEAEELIIVPTAVQHTAKKVGTRKPSTNSKKEECLIELQNLKSQEKEASPKGVTEDAPDILAFRKELDKIAQKHLGATLKNNTTSTPSVNTGNGSVNTSNFDASQQPDTDDSDMPELEIFNRPIQGIFDAASYDEEGMVTDFNNLPTKVVVSPIPTLRIHNIHP
ncbi:hypothetical protein Tco_1306958, partial [Tanacetum coccineum]